MIKDVTMIRRCMMFVETQTSADWEDGPQGMSASWKKLWVEKEKGKEWKEDNGQSPLGVGYDASTRGSPS